jgi:rare lipoprotein A
MRLAAALAITLVGLGCGGARIRERPRAAEDVENGETFRGRASYYHDSLAGNHTANGEVYDPALLTAANRTLPFGTRLRVTRLDNGLSVIVRVNDRGPFGRKTRVLDLSRAAAQKLQMIRAGVVDVEATVLSVPGR